MNEKNKQQFIYELLTTSTGESLGDSGGAYGRHWERNQKKTLADFVNAPSVSFDIDRADTSKEIEYTINVFHYLCMLDIDDICEQYNALECKDFDSDIYGVSIDQKNWLLDNGFTISEKYSDFNTYNGNSNLSQVLQGTYLCYSTTYPEYVLLQVHQGCDVRGGYTDAKLFKLPNHIDYMPSEDVHGDIDGVSIDNGYDGYTITNQDGEDVPLTKDSVISLTLAEY